MTLRIDRIVTRVVQLPLAEPIKHPFMGERTKLTTVLVQVHCSDGCVRAASPAPLTSAIAGGAFRICHPCGAVSAMPRAS